MINVVKATLKYLKPLIPLNLTSIQYIILHHPKAKTATPEDIHQWHLDNGWSGAGYNEYIRKDGTVYIMRGDNVGAHCDKYNSISYGMCCEGNYEVETQMPDAQFTSLIERLRVNSGRFPKAQIRGHCELNYTACPGKYFPLKEAIEKSKGVIKLDWKEILRKVAGEPEKWETAIQTAVNAAKMDGSLGDLEIFEYLPVLIEKVYEGGKNQ